MKNMSRIWADPIKSSKLPIGITFQHVFNVKKGFKIVSLENSGLCL